MPSIFRRQCALSVLSLPPVLAGVSCLSLSVPAFAQTAPASQPVIVSATRIPTPADQVASSVTVITADQIDQRQQRTLPEVLRDVPGLNLVQTGGPGGTTSVFMRGTNANHTKVLIDGVDVSDPSSTDGSFDFSQVLSGDIDKIEVLRGPQSGLYGSDAIGGVINITTKKGEGPAKFRGMAEGGSFGTFNQSAGVSGSEGRFNYALDLIHNRSTSVPVTPENLMVNGQQRVKDLSDNRTLSTRLGADISDDLDVSLVARATQTSLQFSGDHFDMGTFSMAPEASHSYSDNTEFFTRAAVHQTLLDGRFDHTAGIGYSDYRRRYSGTDGVPNYYRGDRIKGDWVGSFKVVEGQTVSIGAESQRDGIDDAQMAAGLPNNTTAHVTNNAGFAQLQSDWNKRIENAVSLRYDDHSRFGGKTTYRLAPALLVPETGTKLKASYGTGYKAPSLDQLYDNYPAYGFYANPNLRPETSKGYDLGFEQKIAGVEFGSTWFHNKIDNLIQSTRTSYTNIGKATTQGFENYIAVKPWDSVTLRGDYTYTLAENDILQQQLLRRPKHKASLTSTWQAMDALSLSASVVTVGDWVDISREGDIPRLKGSGYTTVNLAGSYSLTDTVSLFGRVNNLLDKKVENPIGFEQPGIGAFGGVKVTF